MRRFLAVLLPSVLRPTTATVGRTVTAGQEIAWPRTLHWNFDKALVVYRNSIFG